MHAALVRRVLLSEVIDVVVVKRIVSCKLSPVQFVNQNKIKSRLSSLMVTGYSVEYRLCLSFGNLRRI